MQSFLTCFANQRKNITTVVCKSKPMSKFEAEDWLQEKCPKCDSPSKYLIETGPIMTKLLSKIDPDDVQMEFVEGNTTVNVDIFEIKSWVRPYILVKFINHVNDH